MVNEGGDVTGTEILGQNRMTFIIASRASSYSSRRTLPTLGSAPIFRRRVSSIVRVMVVGDSGSDFGSSEDGYPYPS